MRRERRVLPTLSARPLVYSRTWNIALAHSRSLAPGGPSKNTSLFDCGVVRGDVVSEGLALSGETMLQALVVIELVYRIIIFLGLKADVTCHTIFVHLTALSLFCEIIMRVTESHSAHWASQ